MKKQSSFFSALGVAKLFDKAFTTSNPGGKLLFITGTVIVLICVFFILGILFFDGPAFSLLNDTFKLIIDPGAYDTITYMPRWWQIAVTFVGVVFFTSLLITTLTNYLDNRVEEYRTGKVRYYFDSHIIILGSDEAIQGILESIALQDELKHKKIVVLSIRDVETLRNTINSYISKVGISLNIVFLYGERNNRDTLMSIHMDKASHIFIVGETDEPECDSVNIESWELIKEIRKGDENKAKCFLVLERRSSKRIFQLMPVHKDSGIETSVISLLENLAERVLVNPREEDSVPGLDGRHGIKYEDDKTVHLVIFGMTSMATSLAVTAAHLCHFPNYVKDPTRKTTITFIAPDAKQEMDFFIGTYFNLFALSEYEYIDGDDIDKYIPEKDFLDIRWRFVKGSVEQQGIRSLLHQFYESHRKGEEVLTLAFCGNDPEHNVASALYLPEEFYAKKRETSIDDVTILVYQPLSTKKIDIARSRTYRYSNVYSFGLHSKSYDPTYHERLLAAKKINYLYDHVKDFRGMPENTSELDKLWFGKRFIDRMSSMCSANSIYMKLRSMPSDGIFTYDFEDVFSRVEHNRWGVERLLHGYRGLTDAEKKAIEVTPALYDRLKADLFVNKHLRPYDELDMYIRGNDRIIINNMNDVIKS